MPGQDESHTLATVKLFSCIHELEMSMVTLFINSTQNKWDASRLGY